MRRLSGVIAVVAFSSSTCNDALLSATEEEAARNQEIAAEIGEDLGARPGVSDARGSFGNGFGDAGVNIVLNCLDCSRAEARELVGDAVGAVWDSEISPIVHLSVRVLRRVTASGNNGLGAIDRDYSFPEDDAELIERLGERESGLPTGED